MAIITSASSGNFSAPATWVGGVVPGVGDDAVAATTHVVTIDVDVTVISFQQAGTGKFVLGNGRTVTGNVIANAGTFTSGGTVEATMTTTATINGNVTGVSSTANNIAGIVVTGTGTLTINGSVTGSPGNGASEALGSSAVYTNVTCSIIINGTVTAGSGTHKRAVQSGTSSSSAWTINGNVNGNNTFAVFLSGTSSSATIVGNVSGGSFQSGINMSGNSTAVVIFGNVLPPGGSNTVTIVSGGASSTISVTGNLSGGGTGLTALSVSGALSTVNITGDVIAGSGGNAINISSSVSINVIGNVFGGSGTVYGISANGASNTITVTGNVNGGSGAGAFGIWATGASSTVSVIGSAKAFSTLSHAIRSDATANGVIFQGDMEDSPQGAVAVYTRIFRMSATNSGVTKYANTVGFPAGTLVSRVSPDNVTGMAQIADVRLNTIYGYNNQLTGVLAMPQPQSVAYGVPVDATTGTAELDLGRVAEVIGLQVAAGAIEGTAL